MDTRAGETVPTEVPSDHPPCAVACRRGTRLPVAVSVALPVGLWMLLLLWVIFPVPRYQELFDDFGVRVPVVTELVFRVAAVVRQWPVATLGLLAILMAMDAWLDQSLATAGRASLRQGLLVVRLAVPFGLLVVGVWGVLSPWYQLQANLP